MHGTYFLSSFRSLLSGFQKLKQGTKDTQWAISGVLGSYTPIKGKECVQEDLFAGVCTWTTQIYANLSNTNKESQMICNGLTGS